MSADENFGNLTIYRYAKKNHVNNEQLPVFVNLMYLLYIEFVHIGREAATFSICDLDTALQPPYTERAPLGCCMASDRGDIISIQNSVLNFRAGTSYRAEVV